MRADEPAPKTWRETSRRFVPHASIALLTVSALAGLGANLSSWSEVDDIPCGGIPEAIFYVQPVQGHDVVPALTYLCVVILVVLVLPGLKFLSAPGRRWATVVSGLVVGAVYTALAIHVTLTLDARVDQVRECEDHVANPVGAWVHVAVGVSILLSALMISACPSSLRGETNSGSEVGQPDESSLTAEPT